MAHQYISVKVSGNQIANTGFTALLLYNNPDIEIPDKGYVGFDSCSYFYTITTCELQNIFKLVKNNVRSYGAIRPGNLVIAFSIPKHYKLDGGYTPYDVLNELKKEFLEKCMTLKDSVRETYEFNPGRIDQHVLDEVASKFTISPQSSPNRVMTPNGPKGYIVENDIRIEELFHDINYPEFDNYSEVIVAESVSQTSYIPINNIQIPRPKSYAIYVDGNYQESLTDVNAPITAFTNLNSEYYNNKEEVFTIQKLKDGEFYQGIELHEDEEKIEVSTQGWATPKCRNIKLKIFPQKHENYFLVNRNLLKVTYPFGEIPLNSNLSFTLEGEKIAEISKGTIRLSFKTANDKYSMVSQKVEGDELRVTVEEIKHQPLSFVKGTEQNHLPVCDISIILKGEGNLVGKEIDIKLKVRAGNDSSPITVATCCTKFRSIPKVNDAFECHFYVPKGFSYNHGFLCFQLNNKNYKSEEINFDNEKIVVEDFAVSNVKPFYKKKSFITGLLKLFAAVLLGFIIGFATHDGIKRVFGSGDESADSVVVEAMTGEQALVFLTEADSILKKKDLSFAEVDSLYNIYEQYKDTLKLVDEERLHNKVCDRIGDYHEIVQYIKNGSVEEIKEVIKITDFHIWSKHAIEVGKIVASDAAIECFKNKFTEITRFDNIGDVIQDTPSEPVAESGTNNDATAVGGTTNPGINNRQQQVGRSASTSQNWDCEECKKEGVSYYRYPSKEKLAEHLKNCH